MDQRAKWVGERPMLWVYEDIIYWFGKTNLCPNQYLLEFFKQVIFEVLHLQLISVKI